MNRSLHRSFWQHTTGLAACQSATEWQAIFVVSELAPGTESATVSAGSADHIRSRLALSYQLQETPKL